MMDDLISRKALLNGGIRVSCGLNEDGLLFIPLRDVIESIKKAPAVMQGVPVTERLPEPPEAIIGIDLANGEDFTVSGGAVK